MSINYAAVMSDVNHFGPYAYTSGSQSSWIQWMFKEASFRWSESTVLAFFFQVRFPAFSFFSLPFSKIVLSLTNAIFSI